MTPPADARVQRTKATTPNDADRHERTERTERTERLLEVLAHSPNARERLRLQQEVVLLNLGLADSIAARYAGRGIDWDDLVQEGRVGLVKAVVGYHRSKGVGFPHYAGPTIAGEIKRYFRDHSWMVRPPRRLQQLHAALRILEPNLEQQLHRVPSAGELAKALGVEPGELSDALVARRGYVAISLDAPTRADSDLALGDGLPDVTDQYAEVDRAQWLGPALAGLTDREKRILRLRFVDGQCQEEIGRQLGVSQMQVSRLLTSILCRLRADVGFSDHDARA